MTSVITNTYPISGMSCASCANNIENILSSMSGVLKAQVNFASSSVLIEYEPKSVDEEELKANLGSAGFDLYLSDDSLSSEETFEIEKTKELEKLRNYTIVASCLTAPIAVIGMFFPGMEYANFIMMGLSAIVLFFFGRQFFVNAFKQALLKKANMDTLVATSTSVAYLFSVFNTIYPEYWLQQGLQPHVYFEAAAVIVCFILLGKLLEDKAKSSTATAIKGLMGLQVKTLTIVDVDGLERQISIKEVSQGDFVRVKPGEMIPVDGVVTDGTSYVDESTITGEPIAVQAKKGKSVYSGTLNQKGSFIFRAQKVGGDTVLSQIIKMVKDAQGSKAPVQREVDAIAGIFVPVVILLSVATFTSWMLLGGDNAFSHGLLTSITVLIIACPCALGLATPTAIMVGIGKAAENNILIKNAEALELAHKTNVVVLDKTGTITEGKPVVNDLIWDGFLDGSTQLKSILLAMEAQSEHPLASAIVERLENEGNAKAEIKHFKSITGKGISAGAGDSEFVVGNESILGRFGIELPQRLKDKQVSLQSEGKTVIYFADRSELLATISISDAIKNTSYSAILKLTRQGIDVHMLTGDHPKTAETIAKQVGIKNVIAGVMPAEKADYILSLQNKGLVVAMVGDGINDSQALAQADVSIAMGKGSDIAMDVAQMTLMTSDLNAIPRALELSKQTIQTIKQNLFWAFIYNLIGIPLAAGILFAYNGFLLNPMIAAAAMTFSSISVVLNSVRLKWKYLS